MYLFDQVLAPVLSYLKMEMAFCLRPNCAEREGLARTSLPRVLEGGPGAQGEDHTVCD